MKKCFWVYSIAFLIFCFLLIPTVNAGPPPDFTITPVTSGGALTAPTAMRFAPDGRLFVAEQSGTLRVIDENGALLPTPFLTVTTTTTGERGLLGLAFHPNFETNGYIYVYYTVPAPLHNRISRFQASPIDPNISTGTEEIIFELSPLNPANTDHNGGAMNFGPDGKLYVATGENKNSLNAQSFTNTLGKILRINDDGSIPSDNPFYNTATGDNRAIWNYGFRNPFSIDFSTSGRLFINDVGQKAYEEVNDGIAGANYGWPYREGTDEGIVVPSPPGFTSQDPLFQYDHGYAGFSCAVTGAAFYDSSIRQYPSDYFGDFFYGDFCGGWIDRYDVATGTSQNFITGLGFGLVAIDVSPNGELYFLMRPGFGLVPGDVSKVAYIGAPEITQHPKSQTVDIGDVVNFTCAATGASPLSFQWQRDGVDIVGATQATLHLGAVDKSYDKAQYRCVVTSPYGTVTSNQALLRVQSAAIVEPNITVFDPAISKVGFLSAGGIGLPGEQLTWVTTVSNNSAVDGNNIVIVDNVRPELRIESVETDKGTVVVDDQTVTVTIPKLNAGEQVQFRIITTVLSSPLDGVITNTVTLVNNNISATASLVVARVTQLPNTGQTPWWRSVGIPLSIGVLSLVYLYWWRKQACQFW